MLRRGKEILTYVAGARVPMPKTTREYHEKCEAFVRGETDGTEPDLYGVGITHRRSAWRDWLFLEFGAELFWADGPEPADRCSSCFGATIGIEILFGDAYDRLLRRDARRLPVEPTPDGER